MSEALKEARKRKVTHEQAREAWKKLHDAIYNRGRVPTLSVPPRPEDVDLVLTDYISQQEASEAALSRSAPDREALDVTQYLQHKPECATRQPCSTCVREKVECDCGLDSLLVKLASRVAESPSESAQGDVTDVPHKAPVGYSKAYLVDARVVESASAPEGWDEWVRRLADNLILHDHPGAFAKCKCGAAMYLHNEADITDHRFEDCDPERAANMKKSRDEKVEAMVEKINQFRRAKLPAPEGMGRDALQNILQSWEIFHANLPDGEYKGLGEMRIAIGKLVDLLRIQNPLEKAEAEKVAAHPTSEIGTITPWNCPRVHWGIVDCKSCGLTFGEQPDFPAIVPERFKAIDPNYGPSLKECNESLAKLISDVWAALEPTGEYEGEKNLVEFAKSIRVAKESAEWSLGRIPELEQQIAALKAESGRVEEQK